MRRSVETCECVLRHERSASCYIRRGSAFRPAASAVVESGEDEFGGLVGWGLCEDGDGDGGYTEGVQEDGGVVQVAEEVHAECVDDGVGDEHCCVDADCFGWGGRVCGFDCRGD